MRRLGWQFGGAALLRSLPVRSPPCPLPPRCLAVRWPRAKRDGGRFPSANGSARGATSPHAAPRPPGAVSCQTCRHPRDLPAHRAWTRAATSRCESLHQERPLNPSCGFLVPHPCLEGAQRGSGLDGDEVVVHQALGAKDAVHFGRPALFSPCQTKRPMSSKHAGAVLNAGPPAGTRARRRRTRTRRRPRRQRSQGRTCSSISTRCGRATRRSSRISCWGSSLPRQRKE